MSACMYHARLRAMERVPGVCPGLLVEGIQWAIKNNRRDVLHFVDWQGNDRCFWWGVSANGHRFTAVANPVTGYVITVMRGWKTPNPERMQA